ncbi:cytochrome P450 [Lentinula guzmanii]|uniref:Cytochrome P450 n=1 Tax=Lentinula guzmanii TaxID=2804957 RepID=A0AA38JRS8_9AGAR|nr:cytochrome P450 [Lentinula guzmanii]
MFSFTIKSIFAFVLLPPLYILLEFVYRYYRRSLKFLKGPPRPSLLFGNELELTVQEDLGVLETKWFNRYGLVFRTSSCFGEDTLMVADPQALRYVTMTSAYRFPKSTDSAQITTLQFGRGVLSVEGEVHLRHRKALNPAFSATQLRQFLGLFQRTTTILADKLQQEELGKDGKVINITHWLPRATLDIIGESAFDYKFGAVEGKANELSEIFKHMFVGARLYPQKRSLLYRAFRRSVNTPIANLLLKFPSRQDQKMMEFSVASKRIAKSLFDAASKEAKLEGDTKHSKDVLSVLVRSNLAEDPKKALSEDEVLSQMATLILAGHETTASTMSWLLYEITRNPQDQERVYQEIQNVREHAGPGVELTATDYDSMPFFNAVIKEALRLHPIVPNISREAGSDDSIPLEYPVLSESGERLSHVPVSKGQRISLNIAMYNRLTQVWGDDANTWRPERFMHDTRQDITVGVYSNLMTFSAGVRACIGWRFALMELQAILFCLLERFQFCPPPPDGSFRGLEDIQRVPAGLMIPMKRGNWRQGVQMPLLIKLRQR